MKSNFYLMLLLLSVSLCYGHPIESTQPQLYEFKKFSVLAESVKIVTEKHVVVRALFKDNQHYTAAAKHASAEVTTSVLDQFEGLIPIVSVYEGDVAVGSDQVPFYLVGYQGIDRGIEYFLMEDYRRSYLDALMVEVETFNWPDSSVKN